MNIEVGDYVEHIEEKRWRGVVTKILSREHAKEREVRLRMPDGGYCIVYTKNLRKKHNELELIQRLANEEGASWS